MNMKLKSLEKKIDEFQSTFFSMKEDEPKRINIKNNEFFENETRNNMVKWLAFLCDTLNFNTQTLFRSVIIFDNFISSSTNIFYDEEFTQEKLNLITIACLSLGTKLEEINCNYVSFFTEKVLNLPNCEIFTVKDLTNMEFIILKELNYNTLYTTSIDFVSFYLQIFQQFFNPNEQFSQNIQKLAENMMKQNIMTNVYLNMTQDEYAFACLNQTFIQIGMMNVINQIRNTLMLFNMNNLIKKNKSLEDNNECNDNDDIQHNLEVNLLTLPSF